MMAFIGARTYETTLTSEENKTLCSHLLFYIVAGKLNGNVLRSLYTLYRFMANHSHHTDTMKEHRGFI